MNDLLIIYMTSQRYSGSLWCHFKMFLRYLRVRVQLSSALNTLTYRSHEYLVDYLYWQLRYFWKNPASHGIKMFSDWFIWPLGQKRTRQVGDTDKIQKWIFHPSEKHLNVFSKMIFSALKEKNQSRDSKGLWVRRKEKSLRFLQDIITCLNLRRNLKTKGWKLYSRPICG